MSEHKMTLNPRLIFRWTAFLLAGGYCIRTLIFGGWDAFGGPFRFLTIWALFASFFAFSRMMAMEEGRSDKRWDGFVCMTAVINTMVVFLYWRLYFADPMSVTTDGELGAWHLEMYLHLFGPLLQVIDTIFVHRSYRGLKVAFAWLIGVIAVYVLWAEFVVQPMNDSPAGTVTSGLPYPFLNNLELADRMGFYITNAVVGIVLLLLYAGIAWGFRRRFPAPVTP
ncbi:androgen-induced gene 1 family protein [Yoonia sp.]|nr:androgen-induced gene 1 family protein [Yoonia sp.]MDC1399374.1 androgen-induced gene 1 family protein [Yoonia sp.]